MKSFSARPNGWNQLTARRGFALLFGCLLVVTAATTGQDANQKRELTAEQQQRLKLRDEFGQQTSELRQQGKLAEAIAAAEKMLSIEREVLGNEHADVIGSLEQLAEMHEALENFAAARKARAEMLSTFTKVLGTDHELVTNHRLALADLDRLSKMSPVERQRLAEVATLNQKLVQLGQQGEIEAALPLAREVLEVRKQLLGESHREFANALSNLAELHWTKQDLVAAERFHRQALKIRGQVLGDEHSEYRKNLSRLTQLFVQMEQPGEAVKLLTQFINAGEKKYGADHPRLVPRLNQLGGFFFGQKRYDESEVQLLRAAKILETKLGSNDLELANILYNLGVLYLSSNRLSDSELPLQRSLKIRETNLGAAHSETAMTMQQLVFTYRLSGQPARAVPLLRRLVKIREAQFGEDHLEVADVLNQLALNMAESGQINEVISLHERSLKICESKHPPNHPDIVTGLTNLALAHWRSNLNGRCGKSLMLLDRAIKMTEANWGSNHSELVNPLVNFATLLNVTWQKIKKDETVDPEGKKIAEKRHEECEALFNRALKILEANRESDGLEFAQCLDGLAAYYEDEGKPALAEPLHARCLKIREARLPGTHPRLLESLTTLIRLEAAQDHWQAVADRLDDYNRRMRLHVRINLPSLAPTQQLAFLQRTHEVAFHRCLTLPFLHREDKELIARSAEWILNGKAVAHEVRAEQSRLVRESNDPDAPEIARQLLALRAELDALVRAGKFVDDAGKMRRSQLAEQESQLVSRLSLAAVPSTSSDPWVKLETVRARIPADAVLVEIVDFDLWDFKKDYWKKIPLPVENPALEETWKKMTDQEKAQSRYVAWIIPPAGKGEVQLIDLGDSWDIRRRIENYQKAMNGAVREIQVDEADAELAIRQHLESIAKLCLAPLEKHLAGSPRWILSPDNHLWMVPWAALPLKDGSYAIEKYAISFVTSGRDLLTVPVKVEPGPALVLGDPNFDLGADAALREADQRKPKDRILVRGPARELTEQVPRDWQRLFGTADEIKSVESQLAAYTNAKPQVYTKDQAIETLVKAARRPRVLILSTHGFTLAPPHQGAWAVPEDNSGWVIPARKMAVRLDDLTLIEAIGDPLVRCGLVLAGANKRASDADPSADDGILTGVEVLGCDLRGTELVVLSACETGLGDVNLGEGVAGLRQAFQLAGARSVVASLWKISDDESVKLMTQFWDNLAAGKSKADALRNAQLAVIKERRAKEKAAHPFFWAAFTLTGDWK